jgi:uncharacterized membrane protein
LSKPWWRFAVPFDELRANGEEPFDKLRANGEVPFDELRANGEEPFDKLRANGGEPFDKLRANGPRHHPPGWPECCASSSVASATARSCCWA